MVYHHPCHEISVMINLRSCWKHCDQPSYLNTRNIFTYLLTNLITDLLIDWLTHNNIERRLLQDHRVQARRHQRWWDGPQNTAPVTRRNPIINTAKATIMRWSQNTTAVQPQHKINTGTTSYSSTVFYNKLQYSVNVNNKTANVVTRAVELTR